MSRESITFGSSTAGIVVGLAILLVGEASHDNGLVIVGGLIGLLGFAWMAAAIARMS